MSTHDAWWNIAGELEGWPGKALEEQLARQLNFEELAKTVCHVEHASTKSYGTSRYVKHNTINTLEIPDIRHGDTSQQSGHELEIGIMDFPDYRCIYASVDREMVYGFKVRMVTLVKGRKIFLPRRYAQPFPWIPIPKSGKIDLSSIELVDPSPASKLLNVRELRLPHPIMLLELTDEDWIILNSATGWIELTIRRLTFNL